MLPAAPLSSAAPADAQRPRRSFAYYRNATFMALLVGYVGYYLCRQNFSAAYGSISVALGLDKETFGLMSTVGTAAYALGKFVSGPVAESLGGRRVFLLGLFGSAAATLAFGLLDGLLVLGALWAANRLLQSFGWAGLVNVLPRWYAPARYGTAMAAISISYQAGGVIAPLVIGVLIGLGASWRGLFVWPALALIAVGLVVRRLVVQSPADVGHESPQEDRPTEAAGSEDAPLSVQVRALLFHPRFVAVLGLSFVLTLLREVFGLWMPAYFSDLGASAQAAAFKSTVFPLLGVAGTMVAGVLSDRLAHGRRGPVITAYLVGLALTLWALARAAGISATLTSLGMPMDEATVALVAVGLCGFFILGPYSMVGGGVVALDFGGRRLAATAAGLLDGVGYVGASLAGVGVAHLVASDGWSSAFLTLSSITVGSLLLSAVLWRSR